jgi:hypothetical protein
MSQEYIASLSRGDQSNKPFLHPSLTAEISEPVICDNLFCSGVPDTLVIAAQQTESVTFRPTSFFFYALLIYLHPFHKESHPLHGLSAKWPVKGRNPKPCLNVTVKISSGLVHLQMAKFCLFYMF